MNRPMQEGARQQYLKAMGVDVWVRRAAPLEWVAEVEDTAEALETVDLSSDTSAAPETPIAPVVAEAPVSDQQPEQARAIFQQSANELTQWLGAQRLMPIQVGGKSRSTIGSMDAQLLVLSASMVNDKAVHQPFSGRAAFLLQAMLRAIGESFETVLQAELESSEEAGQLLSSLLEDEPIKVVLLLIDLNVDEPVDCLSDLREQAVHGELKGARIFVSYHPDFLISHPDVKAKAWHDLKQVRDYLAPTNNA